MKGLILRRLYANKKLTWEEVFRLASEDVLVLPVEAVTKEQVDFLRGLFTIQRKELTRELPEGVVEYKVVYVCERLSGYRFEI